MAVYSKMKHLKHSIFDKNGIVAIDLSSVDSKIKQKQEENAFMNCNVIINPGSRYFIQPDDICIYISLVKEENYDWKNAKTIIGNLD